MKRKLHPWRKLSPAQIDLMERIAAAGCALPYGELQYTEILAFDELHRLKFVDISSHGRSKLEAVLTEKGSQLRDNGYRTKRVVFRVSEPQIALLRHLDDGKPYEQSIGRATDKFAGAMLDVCRRMHLRGWVERHGGPDGWRWARLTAAGRDVVAAINEFDATVAQSAQAKRSGRLH